LGSGWRWRMAAGAIVWCGLRWRMADLGRGGDWGRRVVADGGSNRGLVRALGDLRLLLEIGGLRDK